MVSPVHSADPPVAKILLVDDRPANLDALEAILAPLGQTLVRAQSGEDALRALLSTEFAVILLDVLMPGLSGFQTAELIKARKQNRSVPIIFVSAAHPSSTELSGAYEHGAADYITK